MPKINNLRINSFIIAFAFFQFGILLFPATLMNSQIIVAISTILLFIIIILNNKFKVGLYLIYTIILVTFLFFISFFMQLENEVLFIYFEFLIKSFSLFIIASYPYDSKYLYKSFKFLAVINILSLLLIVFTGVIEIVSYMRFGYALLPSLLISFIVILKNPTKLLWVIIFITSFVLIFLYGSRGPFISFILLAILLILLDQKFSITKKIASVFVIIISYIGLIELNLISKTLDYIYYELGLNTYSIFKFRIMLQDGVLSSSSGRDTIYSTTLVQIRDNLIIGNGIGASEILWDITTHNLILQILLELGLLGGLASLILFLFLLRKIAIISRMDSYLFYVVVVVMASSIGRLLVSSDLWLRPEFWLGLSLLLQKSTFNKKIVIK